jgi:hypothetical protein
VGAAPCSTEAAATGSGRTNHIDEEHHMNEDVDHHSDEHSGTHARGEPEAEMKAFEPQDLIEHFGYEPKEVAMLVDVFAQLCWRHELSLHPAPNPQAGYNAILGWDHVTVLESRSALMRFGWHQQLVPDEATIERQEEFVWCQTGWCVGMTLHPRASKRVERLHLCTNHRFGGAITLAMTCEPGQVNFCVGCVSAWLNDRPWAQLTEHQRSTLDRFVETMDDHTFFTVTLRRFLYSDEADEYGDEPLWETVPED